MTFLKGQVRSTTISLGVALVAAVTILLAAAGCGKNPEAPVYGNIFDGESALENPLNLKAVLIGNSIIVSWNQPQNQDIVEYNIYHGTSFSEMNLDTFITHTDEATNKYIHLNATPTASHFFRISALTSDDFSFYVDQTPAEVASGALVVAGTGSGKIASRYTPLTVTVTNGEFLRIADNPEFAVAQVEPLTPDGLPHEFAWDFGAAVDNEEERILYFQVFGDLYHSPTDSLKLAVDFSPRFKLDGGSGKVATRLVDLSIPVDGVLEMRFAASADDLAAEVWLPAAEIHPDYELAAMASSQIIYGEFRGDFGFDQMMTLTVTPDLLDDATFYLVLPEDHLTDESQVTIISNAAATLMRYSESMDFSAVTWEAYQDTSLIQLSPDPGRKVIFGQFRNDWADSPLLTDYVDYITQPAEVAFLVPADGDTLDGGTGLNILGTSTAASGTEPVEGVELDTGGGAGFTALAGTDNWSRMWDIPVFDEDTEVVLRARAFTGTDTVSTFVTVTVSGSGEDS